MVILDKFPKKVAKIDSDSFTEISIIPSQGIENFLLKNFFTIIPSSFIFSDCLP